MYLIICCILAEQNNRPDYVPLDSIPQSPSNQSLLTPDHPPPSPNTAAEVVGEAINSQVTDIGFI